jgi:hypothetical protein
MEVGAAYINTALNIMTKSRVFRSTSMAQSSASVNSDVDTVIGDVKYCSLSTKAVKQLKVVVKYA